MSKEISSSLNSSVEKKEENKKKHFKLKNKAWTSLSSTEEKEIDKKLSAIYKDENGKIPDMKKIEIKKRSIFLRIFLGLLIFGTILSALAWINFLTSPTKKDSTDTYISLDFSGSETVSFGSTTTFIIRYKNLKQINFNKAVLNIRYPAGFIFTTSSLPTKNSTNNEFDLHTIRPFADDSISITGQMYGQINQEKTFQATINFQPENTASPLLKTTSFKSTLKDSPVNLSVTTQDKINPGEEVVLRIEVIKKQSGLPYKFELSPLLPNDFKITTSSPKLERDNKWIISAADFKNNSKLEFELRGKIDKNSSVDLPIGAELFLFTQTTNQKISIAKTELNSGVSTNQDSTDTPLLKLTINDSEEFLNSLPGNLLKAKIHLKNTGKETLSNGILKLSFDAPSYNKQSIFNWNEVKESYDGDIKGEQLNNSTRRGQIMWTEKNITLLSALKPGEETEIEMTLPIKTTDKFDFSSLSNKNIKAQAEFNFTRLNNQELLSSNPITINLDSGINFETRLEKHTNNNEEYKITWIITNANQSLKNVQVTATLSEGVSFESEPTPAGAGDFNEQNRQISWNIPQIPEELDVLAWPFTLTIPKISSGSDSISSFKIEAVDATTNKKIILSQKDVLLK